jgi:hypothetical protein
MNRADRLIQNEILFRKVNERINDLQGDRCPDDIDFMCECADVQCMKVIRLSPRAYQRVRRDPSYFFVLPGHEMPEVEDVVERHQTYLVVEKHEETEQPAAVADPRS